MILKPTLTDINGILHIKSPIVFNSAPEILTHYWSTGINTMDFIRAYGPIEKIEIEEIRSYSGRYCFKRSMYSEYTYIDCINGARTQSTKTDKEPIPCPKVRTGIKTRWNDCKGKWEKELKSGWCMA